MTPTTIDLYCFPQEKVLQHSILLAPKSVLLLEGRDIHIKNLKVDGALVVKAAPGAKVVIDGLAVSNAGWKWTPLEQVHQLLLWLKHLLIVWAVCT